MKQLYKYILLFAILLSSSTLLAQEQDDFIQKETFTVKGLVIESDTQRPISKVNVEVNGGCLYYYKCSR